PRWDGRRCLGWVAGCGWPCRRALPRRGDLGRLLGCALGRGLLLGCHDASPWYKTGNRAVRLPRCPIRVSTVTSPGAPVQGNSERILLCPAGPACPPTARPGTVAPRRVKTQMLQSFRLERRAQGKGRLAHALASRATRSRRVPGRTWEDALRIWVDFWTALAETPEQPFGSLELSPNTPYRRPEFPKKCVSVPYAHDVLGL